MAPHEPIRVYLGHEKLSSSRVGIGTWAIGGGWGSQSDEASLKTIHAALDFGCQLIDTAPLYGNGHAERLIARIFKERGSRVTTCTKVYPLDYQWAPAPGTPLQDIYPPEHIIAQAEGSLQRLGIDCLDCLLFQTWCPSWSKERSWYETMQNLRQQGKIRTFGISVSDHRPEEVIGIIEAGLVDIVEVPYSILDQRAAARLLPVAQQHQVNIIARTPLASGALAGDWYNGMKFPRDDWRRRVFRNELLQQTLQRVAKVRSLVGPSLPLAQIALRFCLSHPAVTAVIPGVRNVDQVQRDLAVLEQDPLPHALLEQIERLWHEEFHKNVRTSIGEEGEGKRQIVSRIQHG